MSDDEVMPVKDAVRSWEWAMGRVAEYRRERDQYRDWFERLAAATTRYIETTEARSAEAGSALAELRGEHERITHARTRANVAKGAETRRRVLEMRTAGRSIAETARELGISVSRVATIRGKAKRS